MLAASDSTDARWLVRGSRLCQPVPKTLQAGKRAESHQEEGPLGCQAGREGPCPPEQDGRGPGGEPRLGVDGGIVLVPSLS